MGYNDNGRGILSVETRSANAFYEVLISTVSVSLWQTCSFILCGFETNRNKISKWKPFSGN